jgi:hypothetical protein
MLIFVSLCLKKMFKKNVFHRMDGQTHVQLKTIVRNLTKPHNKMYSDRVKFLGQESRYFPSPYTTWQVFFTTSSK